MIILLQSAEIQFRRLFGIFRITKSEFYYKLREVAITKYKSITKCDRLLLQSASGVTRVRQTLLQSVLGIPKCDSNYKVRRTTSQSFFFPPSQIENCNKLCANVSTWNLSDKPLHR